MANQLDELSNETRPEGLDTHVIAKKLPVKVGVGSTIFEVILWCLLIIPGLVFLFKKIKAKNYFQQLEQKIQRNASQIDNYLEQRVIVLQNCARLVDKAIDLDKTTFEAIAKYRSGASDEARNEVATQIDTASRSLNVAFENYPDLKAHKEIADAMHVSTDEAELAKQMLDAARSLNRAKVETQDPEEEDPEDNQAVEDTAYFQTRQRISELLSGLSEQETKLIALRFGLEGGLPLSPEDTGKRLGLTPEEVVTMEAAALAKMRKI